MIKHLHLLGMFLLLSPYLQAQEKFIYANFNKNTGLVNPANMGMDSSTSLTAFGRKQWAGINDAPVAFSFTGNTFLRRPGIAVGLVAEHKKIAVISYTSLGAMVSKTVNITSTERLSLGFYGGMDNFSTRYGGLGQGDPLLAGKQPVNEWRGVAGFGIMLHRDNFYIGASMPRIKLKRFRSEGQLRPEDEGNSGYVAAGSMHRLGEYFAIAPSLLYNIFPQDKPLDIGATVIYRESAAAGLTWRSTGEMNAALQYTVQRRLQLGYSYIFAAGNRRNIIRFSSGSHEIFVNYRIPWAAGAFLPYKWW